MTDARGSVTSYGYDSMNRRVTRTDPLGRSESYAYDLYGNLTSVTDRKAQVTSRSYDALNRVTQVTYADASTTTYTWDAGNRLTQLTDSLAGTITRTYDLLDRLLQEQTPQGTVSYTYDAAGRRTSLTVAGQAPVTYTYDAAGRLLTITQGANVTSVAYDPAGRPAMLAHPNGVTTAYSYDATSRLTGLTYTHGTTTLGTLTYGYDDNGQRRVVGGTWARTGLPQPQAGASYDAANRPLMFGGQALTHDLNGNLTDDGATSYTWDARDRLTGLSGPGLTATFGYDPAGRRASRTVNGATTGVQHDGLNPVTESTSGGTAFILGGLGLDSHLMRGGSDPRGLLTDALGSTIAEVDSAGTVATDYTYEPFGAVTPSGGPSDNRLRFTGREDDGTGLYYYRARYYHPTLQRFLSEGPIEFAGGDVNLYTYVRNNPVRFVDPSGNVLSIITGIAGGALAGGVAGGLVGGISGFATSLIEGQGLTQAIQSGVVSAGSGALAGAIVGGTVGGLAGGGFLIGVLAGQGANIGLPITAGSIAGTIAGGLTSILGPPVSPTEGAGGSLGAPPLSGRK